MKVIDDQLNINHERLPKSVHVQCTFVYGLVFSGNNLLLLVSQSTWGIILKSHRR